MTHEEKLSTSKLAELVGAERKLLFKLLEDNHWIFREGDHWRLTEQGQLHGGSYQQSEKFGEYIVWPSSIAEHELLSELESPWVSSTRLGEIYGITPSMMNAIFADLQWIEKDQRGWMLTESGKKHGGDQRSGKHGFFVMWPGSIKENKLFSDAVHNVLGKSEGPTLDGHACVNEAEKQIDNWLYLHHVSHAYRKPLVGTNFASTFYIPARKVHILYWGFDPSTGSLSEKMARVEYFQTHGLKFIELDDDDINNLDEVLHQKLLQHGLQVGR